ncbi:hypothetical protein KWG64_07435 [Rahnella sp. PD12R]|uniref:hypothetical protein n=1 Tax=Rahnella sp. PD12R TaxID=2855688 RepID=UPI001C442384|nr:hypothetical protein [Rahnella sp. PD12R]MBV6817774.1 hypothetical protein [Rahnella sp. PD12R]
MSDIPVVDVATQTAAVTLQASGDVTITSPGLSGAGVLLQTAATEAKVGVADLDAALNFIESGVAQLGDAAKDELKTLARKYL